MELIILGQTSDDKGKQLEKLTHAILVKMGYVKVTTNEIGNGGNEIDVIAEFVQPGIGNETKRLLICECKAYKTAISTDDWMKFLGKIFTTELNNGNVDGCFIALNGANGNVKGQYRALREKRNNIHLVSGEELYKVLEDLYALAKVADFYPGIAKQTTRKISNIDVCYYEESLYWLVAFTDGVYTILDRIGKPTSREDSFRIQTLVGKVMDFQNFIDLKEESENKYRQDLVEKYIISILLLDVKAKTADEIRKRCNAKYGKFPVEAFEPVEIETSLSVLTAAKIVANYRNTYQLKAFKKDSSPDDSVTLLRRFFDEFFIIIALGCPGYKKLINDKLLSVIAEVQGNLPIPHEKRKDWLKILQWSPSALGWAVHPDQFILQHRGEPFDDMMNASDIGYFNQKLSTQFSTDFTHAALGDYFLNQCGLVELETEQKLNIKSAKKTLVRLDFQERIKLGNLHHDHGEQVIALRLLPGLPEPWEESFTSKKDN